ncbi:MAG: tetratricopeptide repeat protein, partial [Myxococcales bacterium]|nr:tetratricopeptide repeat protein [Myxococcales bacterium]
MGAILDQHKSSFESDPSNRLAFEAIEEHLFMSGMWNELIALYNRRLEAPEFESDPLLSIPILFRLAQVCEERALAVDRAIETYWKVAKIDPSYRPALRQLRQIYAHREQWDMVLQIAEMEEQLEMSTHEKASFSAELGDVWKGKLNDPTEALTHYEKALALVDDHIPALSGLAQVHEGLGHHEQAAAAWERLAERTRGPDRAPILVSLGNILDKHLDQSSRAMECFQRALTDDPRYASAVEALSVTATRLEDWLLVAKLYERRFDIASGARKRIGIAVDAARLNLEELNDTQASRMWLDRALEFGDGDAPVYEVLAELERRTGNRDALRTALDRLIELQGDDVSTSLLVEAADLYSESGVEAEAIALLRKAQIREPENTLVIEALSDGLAQLGMNVELVEVLERRAALTEDDPQAKSEIYAEIGRIRLEDLDEPEAGMENFTKAFDLDPSTKGAAAQLERLYRKNEDWSGLRTLLERAGREGPASKRSHYFASLGEVCEQQFEDNDGAISAFESALELDPHCVIAHQGMARIVHASGNPDELLRICEREAETTTDRVRMGELVWSMLPLLQERERHGDALTWVEKLNQMCPNDCNTLKAVVELREALGQRDELQDPMERLDRVLSGAEQTTNRRKLAQLHRDAGRHEQAIEWYQTALDSDPGHLESLRSLKALYSETRDLDSLARTMRRLGEVLPDQESCDEFGDLASLLAEQIGDVEGAIVVLWRLAKIPADQRPDDIDERLEGLLERAGRFEELVQRLLERRRMFDDESNAARELDLRRAKLLLEHLGQYEEAASLFGSLRAHDSQNKEILDGLEKALRLGNDVEGLVGLLADLAEHESDPTTRTNIEMERATLLEDILGAFDEALIALTKLAEQTDVPELAVQAGRQLEKLLTRSGDWEALRTRLVGRLGNGSQEDDLALHEELALLSRDRFGEPEACVEHLEAAGKIAPDRQPIWHNLAVLYAELDRPEDLLRVLEHELTLGLDLEREIMLRSRAARLANDLEDRQETCSQHYEQILRLEPGHAEATEYLLEFYDRECRPADMAGLLHARLDATVNSDEPSDTVTASAISLRLRISALESLALDDDAAAVATLEPAIAEVGPTAAIAKPLVELYQRLGRREEYIALSLRAADHCDQPEERAGWFLRLEDVVEKNEG